MSSEVTAALVGTALGFSLSVLYAELRSLLARRREAVALRQLIYLEIDQNLRLASELRRQLYDHGANPESAPETVRTYEAAKYLVAYSLPPFSIRVWKLNLARVTGVIGGTELKRAFLHYGYLDSLPEKRETLIRMREMQNKVTRVTLFNENAIDIANDLTRQLEHLISNGNPVPPSDAV